MIDAAIRRATPEDAPAVRRLITETLLQFGFDAPDPRRDVDLVDAAYYLADGRALWVAASDDGIRGCVAIDRGEPGIAVVRRLAGEPLYDLLETATDFARVEGYSEVETILPPGMTAARHALEEHGFRRAGTGTLLYRRPL